MRYVFDIDGTICSNTNGRYELAAPNTKAIEKINKLYKQGHTIIYYTARGMGRNNDSVEQAESQFRELTEHQLNYWGCNYHKLLMGKPSGDLYIDDKGVSNADFF